MRVVKYKTVLTHDQKVALEKEVCVNAPKLERRMISPERVAMFAKHFLRMHEQSEEYMYMICVNTKLELTSIFEISHGKALLANAVSIFLMHNHPSGDTTPSREDIQVTKRLVDAGNLIGIQVLDHIIIGRPGFTSLKEKGYI